MHLLCASASAPKYLCALLTEIIGVFFCLKTEHCGVFAVLLHQLVMCPAFRYPPAVEHIYPVSHSGGRKPV